MFEIVLKILFSILWVHGVYSRDSRIPKTTTKPNIVIIMVDDMGFNDVSFRGSLEIPTPNIDALAYNGVILNRFYTPPLCTPSRTSLMTGKYPLSIGMQNFVITSCEPFGLPLSEKIMPQYFKEAGYKTHLIGKWHLGFYQRRYAPTERGFDSFFGCLGSHIDYWNYTRFMTEKNYSRGYDLRKNLEISRKYKNVYATKMFTKEAVAVIRKHDKDNPMLMLLSHLAPHAGYQMEAPQDEIKKFSYIKNPKRRKLAAMISILDKGIGDVVKALKKSSLLENTIIVLYSDNGGPTVDLLSTNASNYPLRGQKHSGWEGAIRTNAIIYSPFLKQKGVVRNQYVHVADLLPTLGYLAGIDFSKVSCLDGVNQWNVVNNDAKAVRDEIVHIDEIFEFGSIIKGDYKIVNGTVYDGAFDGWLSSKGGSSNINFEKYINLAASSASARAIDSKAINSDSVLSMQKQIDVKCSTNSKKASCHILNGPCLFNISEDPCEENDLSKSQPNIMSKMQKLYDYWLHKLIPSIRKKPDQRCDPVNFNNTWNWWQNE